MNYSVGIRSLSVAFPNIIRTNDYWREHFPELVAQAEPKRSRSPRSMQAIAEASELDIWSQAVAPYLVDPFRGNLERRVLAESESSLELEYRAAQEALAAADVSVQEIDLLIVASLFPEPITDGSAVALAQTLELTCPAWNLESTCSSALIALQTAAALMQMTRYRKVLIVVSQIGSRSVDPSDTLAWSMGDGAGAWLVDRLDSNQGILATHVVSTAATQAAYLHELVVANGQPQRRTRTGDASCLAETAVAYVQQCCQTAAKTAGITLDEINFFAFNTPTAWYSEVCARSLNIDPARTINLYPRYANIGPVSPIANLYHAAQAGLVRKNDLVLVYSVGAGATAAATVMRWADVMLGAAPAAPLAEAAAVTQVVLPSAAADSAKPARLSREVLLTAPAEAQMLLETYLLQWLSNSLQLSAAQITVQQPLSTLLDSLSALLLKRQLETDLQLNISIERFFGRTTIAQLAELVLNQLAMIHLNSLSPEPDTVDRETLML